MRSERESTPVVTHPRFEGYQRYTDSGIEWLGMVPAHWTTSKVKYLGRYVNGYAFRPDDWSIDGRPIVRIQNLTNPDAPFNRFEGELDQRYRVRRGDILISWSASLGLFEWPHEEDGWLNQHIFKVELREGLVDRGFFVWLGTWFVQELKKETHGSTMTHLTTDVFGGFRVEVPPLEEQCLIAAFLDREIGRIDALVAKKERLIELLQERRTGLITQAVTSGLDPTVPMKASRVEWLGQVPAHWETVPARHLFRQVEQPPPEDTGVVTAFRDGQVTLRDNRRAEGYTFAIKEVGYQRVRVGDLVVQGMDAFAGAIGVSDSNGKCSPEYLVLEPRATDIEVNFFASVLRLMAKRGFVQVVSNAVRERAPRFRLPQFQDVALPVPPPQEQRSITAHLARETAHIDALITKVREAIAHLQELRSALISAAVTGKIDVREEVG